MLEPYKGAAPYCKTMARAAQKPKARPRGRPAAPRPEPPPPMSAEDFVALGQEIYGDGWQTTLAARFGRHPRQFSEYARGAAPVPEVIRLALIALLDHPKER